MQWNILFFFNSVLLGVGLAMDAFSVSLANGLNEPHMSRRLAEMMALASAWTLRHSSYRSPRGTRSRSRVQ